MGYTYKPKVKLTKQDVIRDRLKGLKHLDRACAIVPKDEIIKKAIAVAQDPAYAGIWGNNDTWAHFDWAFGNVFREIVSPKVDLSTTFNLDEALTEDEMKAIAASLGITETYVAFHFRAV